MKHEYVKIYEIPFLVRDSLELAKRIDDSNPHLHPELIEQDYRAEFSRYLGSLPSETRTLSKLRIAINLPGRTKYTLY